MLNSLLGFNEVVITLSLLNSLLGFNEVLRRGGGALSILYKEEDWSVTKLLWINKVSQSTKVPCSLA